MGREGTQSVPRAPGQPSPSKEGRKVGALSKRSVSLLIDEEIEIGGEGPERQAGPPDFRPLWRQRLQAVLRHQDQIVLAHNFVLLTGGRLNILDKPVFIQKYLENFPNFSAKKNAGGLVFKVPKDKLYPLILDIDVDLSREEALDEELYLQLANYILEEFTNVTGAKEAGEVVFQAFCDIDEETGPESDCALSAESAVSRAEEDIDALFDDIRVAD